MTKMYTKEAFIRDSLFLFGETKGNTVEIPGRGNIDLYDLPMIGFADAGDELFRQYKQPEIIGTNFLTPVQIQLSPFSCRLQRKYDRATGQTGWSRHWNGCTEG